MEIDFNSPEVPKPSATPRNESEETAVREMQTRIVLLETHGIVKNSMPVRKNRYVLEHGKFYDPARRPKGIRKGKSKACYGNSQMLTLNNPSLTYVEGFALDNLKIMLFEHGWCIASDGTVIDVTWKEPGTMYYGVAFDRNAVMTHLERTVVEKGVSRAIMEPDFFYPDCEWDGEYYHHKSKAGG